MVGREGTVEIAARPEPIDVRADETAVVVVDMQNDFASAGGMFDRAGVDVGCIQAIVAPTATLLDAARGAGIHVLFLKMGFEPDLRSAGAPSAPIWIKHLPFEAGAEVRAPDGSPSRILVRDTCNTDIVEELQPRDDDVIVYKHRYSGFYGTDLDAELRARDIDTLIVVGATTSVCVESTVRDAMFRDYRCLVVEDCVAEPMAADTPRSNHEASLHVLELLFAWITRSSSVIHALTRM
jgi:ureidoacrylate peracid hydrolase